jgi:hypothetical protein
MARPQKNTVTYFPLDCDDGKKMYYIEETYGNDGYATFIKILRELARSEFHYLNLSKPTTLMFLSAKCKVSKELLERIITDLVHLGKFNEMLWEENKIIWCQDFIDSIQDAYFKRKNKCITLEGLLSLLEGLRVRKPSKRELITPVNTQSKVEYSKEEQRRTEKNREEQIKALEIASTDNVKINEIVNIFNSICNQLPSVSEITQERKSAILEIESKYGLEKIGIAFKLISKSDYLNGKINNWKASFDWVFRPGNLNKILEGNYENNGNGNKLKSNNTSRTDAELKQSADEAVNTMFGI